MGLQARRLLFAEPLLTLQLCFARVCPGIELLLSTRVISVDVARKRLVTDQKETIAYVTLIVATGARVSCKRDGLRKKPVGKACYDVVDDS